MAVLVHHPFQHLAAAVVVEVGINIRQRDTVRIQETLEQQVILQRVNLRDTQTVGHHRTGSRATARTYPDIQLVAGGIDEVLHDEEVAREAHRLHDMKFEANAVQHLGSPPFCPRGGYNSFAGSYRSPLGGRRGGHSIAPIRPLIRQLRQVVGLELDAVDLVVAAKLLDFLLTLLTRQRVLAVLVGGELSVEVFLRELLAPLLLGAERLGNGEERHNRVVIQRVDFHLI